MPTGWNSTKLTTIELVLDKFESLQKERWMFRGQSQCYNNLLPSIDRLFLHGKPREYMLSLEAKSIKLFQDNVKFFAAKGEEAALTSEIVALMVLRHYGVPTRLIDWSSSPWVAVYFAICDHDESDCEIWTFDNSSYAAKGKEQWRKWPQTTIDGSGDADKFDYTLRTAFLEEDQPDWFVCLFYGTDNFPRQNAQSGSYSLTSRFGMDHADSIRDLLKDQSSFHRYIIPSSLKSTLRQIIRATYNICRELLFPDSAGAAETVKMFVYNK